MLVELKAQKAPEPGLFLTRFLINLQTWKVCITRMKLEGSFFLQYFFFMSTLSSYSTTDFHTVEVLQSHCCNLPLVNGDREDIAKLFGCWLPLCVWDPPLVSSKPSQGQRAQGWP